MAKTIMNGYKFLAPILVLFLAGCAIPGNYMGSLHQKLDNAKITPITEAIQSGQAIKPAAYRIGNYDVLSIIVWDHPELTVPSSSTLNLNDTNTTSSILGGSFNSITGQTDPQNGIHVDANGCIFFPYAGEIKVVGLTINEARARLAQKLKKYIKNPQITIRVTAFRSQEINVLGEVLHPAVQPLTNKPLSLLEAINYSGGVNPLSADTNHIYVVRGEKGGFHVYWLNAATPGAMLIAERFYLAPNDIVFVAPAGISNWNKVVSQILPTLQTIWYTKTLINS